MIISIIRKLINETLLIEELSGGKLATLYHGSHSPPDVMIPIFLQDQFDPGKAGGSSLGKGIYGGFTLDGITGQGNYGNYIYKLRVNLDGFISNVPEITRIIHGRNISLHDQLILAKIDKKTIKYITNLFKLGGSKFDYLFSMRYLAGEVKGYISDMNHVVIFDPGSVYPIAWKDLREGIWNKIDFEEIKKSGAIDRSVLSEPVLRRYEQSIVPNKIRKGEMIKYSLKSGFVKGDLTLTSDEAYVDRLPDGLHVDGSLIIDNSILAELPNNLVVEKDLTVLKGRIKMLPYNLFVGGNLNIGKSVIQSISAGARIIGSLQAGVKLIEIPVGLDVGKDLDLRYTNMITIPENLSVGNDFYLSRKMSQIPSSLRVSGNLYLASMITSFSEDAVIGGSIFGIDTSQDLSVFPDKIVKKVVMPKVRLGTVQPSSGRSLDDMIDDLFK